MSSSNSMKSVTNTQSTVSNFVISSETVKAEIRWLLKSVISVYRNNSSANLNNLVSCMFPDSQLAKSLKLGADKVRYSINFGLTPFFKSLLYEYIKKSCCFVACFDESLNLVTQTCEMDIVIRFFNESKNLVESRYWNPKFFGHGTAADLEREFEKHMEELDQSKMCQISVDVASVNWKFFSSVTKKREEDELPALINIGSCGLHVIHGAFKTGVEATNWNIKKTLRSAFYILHDYPARREDYESVTDCSKYPLNFCATR